VHAMQYEITLPAAYDMSIIRHRVATRGSGTDTFPGLGLKAYGIREKDVDGSPVNQYAPFYLWATPAGMNEFLFGPAFAGLSADFGRPTVRHWNGLAFALGPLRETTPKAATRTTTRLSTEVPLQETINSAIQNMQDRGDTPGVHSTAVVVDPATWELVHFTLWAEAAPQGTGDRYEVLHTSTPDLQDLPHGRAW